MLGLLSCPADALTIRYLLRDKVVPNEFFSAYVAQTDAMALVHLCPPDVTPEPVVVVTIFRVSCQEPDDSGCELLLKYARHC